MLQLTGSCSASKIKDSVTLLVSVPSRRLTKSFCLSLIRLRPTRRKLIRMLWRNSKICWKRLKSNAGLVGKWRKPNFKKPNQFKTASTRSMISLCKPDWKLCNLSESSEQHVLQRVSSAWRICNSRLSFLMNAPKCLRPKVFFLYQGLTAESLLL